MDEESDHRRLFHILVALSYVVKSFLEIKDYLNFRNAFAEEEEYGINEYKDNYFYYAGG
jgi:hypothetical protein